MCLVRNQRVTVVKVLREKSMDFDILTPLDIGAFLDVGGPLDVGAPLDV